MILALERVLLSIISPTIAETESLGKPMSYYSSMDVSNPTAFQLYWWCRRDFRWNICFQICTLSLNAIAQTEETGFATLSNIQKRPC